MAGGSGPTAAAGPQSWLPLRIAVRRWETVCLIGLLGTGLSLALVTSVRRRPVGVPLLSCNAPCCCLNSAGVHHLFVPCPRFATSLWFVWSPSYVGQLGACACVNVRVCGRFAWGSHEHEHLHGLFPGPLNCAHFSVGNNKIYGLNPVTHGTRTVQCCTLHSSIDQKTSRAALRLLRAHTSTYTYMAGYATACVLVWHLPLVQQNVADCVTACVADYAAA